MPARADSALRCQPLRLVDIQQQRIALGDSNRNIEIGEIVNAKIGIQAYRFKVKSQS